MERWPDQREFNVLINRNPGADPTRTVSPEGAGGKEHRPIRQILHLNSPATPEQEITTPIHQRRLGGFAEDNKRGSRFQNWIGLARQPPVRLIQGGGAAVAPWLADDTDFSGGRASSTNGQRFNNLAGHQPRGRQRPSSISTERFGTFYLHHFLAGPAGASYTVNLTSQGEKEREIDWKTRR